MKKLRSRRLLLWGLAALLLAMLWAIPVWQSWQTQRFRAEVEQLGGFVNYGPYDNPSQVEVSLHQLFRHPIDTCIMLDNCEVDDAWLARHRNALARFPAATLGVSNSQVTDAGIAHLIGKDNIRGLGLANTQITDAGLPHLGEMELEMIDLRGTRVTDQGVTHLTRLQNLEVLALGHTQVTDAGIQQLTQMTTLQWLSLNNTPLTDEGLKQLAQLPKLRYLNVKGTQVTPQGVAAFKQLRPGCQVDGP